MQKRAVLAMVVKTLAGLHGRSIVHGALSPSAVIWHSRDNAMKVADLCCAAPPGELAPHVTPTLRFSPPEVRSCQIRPHARLRMCWLAAEHWCLEVYLQSCAEALVGGCSCTESGHDLVISTSVLWESEHSDKALLHQNCQVVAEAGQ